MTIDKVVVRHTSVADTVGYVVTFDQFRDFVFLADSEIAGNSVAQLAALFCHKRFLGSRRMSVEAKIPGKLSPHHKPMCICRDGSYVAKIGCHGSNDPVTICPHIKISIRQSCCMPLTRWNRFSHAH